MNMENILRAAAIACIMTASSCAIQNDGSTISSDPAVNHPIAVEPSFREIKLGYGGPDGLSTDDAIKFDAFLAEYRAHGNGSLGISVPAGASSRATTTFFAERAAATGIPRDKILVSTHDVANGDQRVDVSFITYVARASACGDWSENMSFTVENHTARNLGCATQRNLAAMVSDPRDLLGPRRFDPADANRATTVITNYEQGLPTAAQKTGEQSGSVSEVGSQ
jgi:pilus assembly protein CpaD